MRAQQRPLLGRRARCPEELSATPSSPEAQTATTSEKKDEAEAVEVVGWLMTRTTGEKVASALFVAV